MRAVLARQPYGLHDQQGPHAWKSPSRGVVVEGFDTEPPSRGLFAEVKDWEEIAPPHTWDHDHCEFCSAKFVPAAMAADVESESSLLTEGYVTVDQGTGLWICDKCFADFKDEFQWSVRAEPDPK